MKFFNSENISVSLTINEKTLFLFIYVGISNIVPFQPLNRIQLSPGGAYSRGVIVNTVDSVYLEHSLSRTNFLVPCELEIERESTVMSFHMGAYSRVG